MSRLVGQITLNTFQDKNLGIGVIYPHPCIYIGAYGINIHSTMWLPRHRDVNIHLSCGCIPFRRKTLECSSLCQGAASRHGFWSVLFRAALWFFPVFHCILCPMPLFFFSEINSCIFIIKTFQFHYLSSSSVDKFK